MKTKYIKIYKEILKSFEALSTCCKLNVAALIVLDSRIISTGYNGTVSGDIHCKNVFKEKNINKHDEEFAELHLSYQQENEVHAEANAIAFAAKLGVSTNNTSIFVSVAPCSNCAKLIVQAGIKRVYYVDEYSRSNKGLLFLKKHNLNPEKI